MNNLAQQVVISVAPDISGTVGSSVVVKGPLVGIETVGDLISVLLSFIFPFAGILLFFFFVRGGFTLLTSKGDPEKINHGKDTMIHALFGFILLSVSFVIAGLVARIFGLGLGFF